MIKKVIAAVVLVALFAVAMVQAMDKEDKPEEQATASLATGLEVGSEAPDFELKSLSGETIKLSDLRGKKVILNFWATWCPPCQAEMPHMQKFYEETSRKDVEIIAVNLDPQADVAGFAKERNLTFPIVLDENEKTMKMYSIVPIPTTFFLDEKGTITHIFMGKMTVKDMKKYTK